MKTTLKVIAFILVLTVSSEFFINKSSSTLNAILFAAVNSLAMYYLLIKPLKKIIKP